MSQPKCELIARGIITQNSSLLLNCTKLNSGGNYYALAGGHVEAGESCPAALQREIREELDIDCEIGQLAFVLEQFYQDQKHQIRHEIVLYFDLSPKVLLPQQLTSPEPAKNFVWLPISELTEANLLPVLSKQYLQKYFCGTLASRYGLDSQITSA